ncbi:protocatechuate 3,4-dioxygenase [Herbaspirillum sp. SJZ099]|uniref:protocatechuate 3,4-dioxygenase n=1 Tax=Herbaspirillum sp. SJZ099 TaxID=2572916 RepID=UPI0011A5BF9B|nr:protocatechuate 3,4-dioxygenase [Herbaspirillum sp. SJZ099]TWC68167.1 protocatechuate 3,4-dioxygenase alpha subunit [Herbaspirillum sp. SJZ099]
MSKLDITTSQTIGPFPHEAWAWAVELTAGTDSPAPQVRVHGAIIDGDGAPINDAWAEAWLPGSAAAESAHAIPGYRRVPTDDSGAFAFSITQPQAPAGKPAAYVTVFARGLVKHQFTAVFLEDDPALAQSALLEQVPAERRGTLIARKQADGSYLWNIHMQGERETVFFDYV